MKTFILLASLIVTTHSFAETDQEKVEQCQLKFKQVALDAAYEDLGCKYSAEVQKAINQNMVKTVAKCQATLKDEERARISKTGILKAENQFKSLGQKAACQANADAYTSAAKAKP